MANKDHSSDEYDESDKESIPDNATSEVPVDKSVEISEAAEDLLALPSTEATLHLINDEPVDELEYQLNAEMREKSKIEAGHYYTDPSDGTCYEWDEAQRAWFPRVTEDFLAAYQMSYGSSDSKKSIVPDIQIGKNETMNSTQSDYLCKQVGAQSELEDCDSCHLNEPNNEDNFQRNLDEEIEANDLKGLSKKVKKDPEWFELESDKNTWIYISGLPLDMTSDDFLCLVGKYGLVMEDPNTEKKKFKMYTDEEGNFKGDAKCCYLRKESIPLAIQMLHGTKLPGSSSRVKVEQAKFTMKGDFNPKLKPKKKNNKKKKKNKQENLLDWRDRAGGNDLRPKHAKIVIMKNCFDPKQFLEDACMITEIRDDIREECDKLGPVKKVILFDRHPEGVVSVKFGIHEAADDAVKGFDKRWFAGKQIEAHLWDGVTDYAIEETAMEREARIASWHKFIGVTGGENSESSLGDDSSLKPTVDHSIKAKPKT